MLQIVLRFRRSKICTVLHTVSFFASLFCFSRNWICDISGGIVCDLDLGFPPPPHTHIYCYFPITFKKTKTKNKTKTVASQSRCTFFWKYHNGCNLDNFCVFHSVFTLSFQVADNFLILDSDLGFSLSATKRIIGPCPPQKSSVWHLCRQVSLMQQIRAFTLSALWVGGKLQIADIRLQ